MPDHDDAPGPFLLGLTMAGAVSAGAYTAGVLDFLLRALDAHNARCDPDAPAKDTATPRHKVVLKAVSGASAGGVCTGLAVVGLIENQKPGEARLADVRERASERDAAYPFKYSFTFDALHSVWVEDLDLWRQASQQGFLALDDLEKKEQLQSILNGKHIDDAADAALGGIRWGAEGVEGKPYSFLASDLDMFLTTTNLMGAPYDVRFTGGEDEPIAHKMAQHSAVRHFRLPGLGEHEFGSPWLRRWEDDGIPLTLPGAGGVLPFDVEGSTWADFKISAMATGAFPVGLAPRLIAAEAHDFGVISTDAPARGGALPIEADPKVDDPDGADRSKWRHPRPAFGDDIRPADKVHYVAVDGGVANNEPFEYARFTLRDERRGGEGEKIGGDGYLRSNAREAERADRAVIMIDPFPEGPEHVPLARAEADEVRGMLPSVKRLFPALINQARFKPAELMHAVDQNIHSRFLISPSRRSDEDRRDGVAGAEVVPDEHAPATGADAIASGAFAGFSGFFDHSFRVHDFVLGQRNCQSFLKNYFTLDVDNPVLRLPKPVADKLRKARTTRRRVIDPGDEMLNATIELPAWPRIDDKRLELLLKQTDRRLGAVGARLVGSLPIGDFAATLIGLAWGKIAVIGFDGIKNTLNAFLIKVVLGELIRRDQHADYKDLGEKERDPFLRAVVVALLNRGEKAATAKELLDAVREQERGLAAGADEREVEKLLETLHDRGLAWRAFSLTAPRRYTHRHFRPGWRSRAKLLAGAIG